MAEGKQQQFLKQTLVKANTDIRIDVQGLSVMFINITGTFVGTVVFEYTVNGSDWFTLSAMSAAGALETGATAVGRWLANVAGMQAVRFRCSAYTSGTISVAARAVASGNVNGISPGGTVAPSQVTGVLRANKVDQKTDITSSTSETTVLTAGGAGVLLDVYAVIVSNTSASAADVTFRDDTAGTTRFNIQVPAGDVRGFMLPVDAGFKQAVANKPWTAQSSASVASLKITVMAVKNS